ncbi:RPC7L polymerase, partial [Pachycephala philippinensis]|nr:RPC7L polymerase [Pachycephala philippinensis]
MAGRGRGRGRGQMTFNVEAVGIGKGDALPPPTLQPSPLFPVSPAGPSPIPIFLSTLLFHGYPPTVPPAAPTDIERYSDKYQLSSPVDSAIDWNPVSDPFLPQPRVSPLFLQGLTVPCAPPGTAPLVPKPHVALDKEETIKKLESLEKKEEEGTSEEEEEKEEEEEGKEEEEEEYDEEEHEEETDYVLSYFDNGESFGPDSDDNGDEAVY